jgi:predicted dehydrogenase
VRCRAAGRTGGWRRHAGWHASAQGTEREDQEHGDSGAYENGVHRDPLSIVWAGVEGHVELSEAPFNPPNDRPCIVRLQRGGEVQRLELAVCDQYTIQGDRFAEAILHETPVPIPLEDAVRNMEVIEAVIASGCSGGWVRPGGG